MHLNLDVNYGLPVGARTRTLLTLRFTLRLRTRTPLRDSRRCVCVFAFYFMRFLCVHGVHTLPGDYVYALCYAFVRPAREMAPGRAAQT